MKTPKAELVESIAEIRRDHEIEIKTFPGDGPAGWVQAPYCPSCGYIDEYLHSDNIVVEYLQQAFESEFETYLLEQKAKAWDKGWAKGARGSGITPMRISYIYPAPNANRNPYRHQLQAKEKYDTDRSTN